MLRLLAWIFLLASLGSSPGHAASVVAAASDLRFALDDIVSDFEKHTGVALKVTYGSSGNFTRQIEQGAPFELFFSADEALVERLASQGLTRDRGTLYAIGRIVLFAPHASPLELDPELRGLARLVERNEVTRFAIANPEHAPYGRAAVEALRALGLWERLRPRLVLGENVSQAAQFATLGDVAGGIIAHSLAVAPEVRARGRFELIPERLHAPLRQRMVLLRNARGDSERLYRYVQSPSAKRVLATYGFTLPDPP